MAAVAAAHSARIVRSFQALEQGIVSESEHALARRYAPYIHFDAREPFLPTVVGYTVFHQTAPSPSFPRCIQLDDNIALAIEYAIWWDWDIQHLYELEHIWVYIDAAGQLLAAEASWHGRYHQMLTDAGQLPLRAGRLALYSEPGKHAFAPSPERLLARQAKTVASCGLHAGKMGLHVTSLFEGIIQHDNPLYDRLVHSYLERRQFEPSYAFSQVFDLRQAVSVPWAQLFAWIPQRVSDWLDELSVTIPPHQRRVLRIAHRGASAYAQESSPEALRIAAELGADMVELDLRKTADDQPIISHDSGLQRVYGIAGSVEDFSLAELRRLTAGKGHILSFEEAVDLCRELGLSIYLDIKELNEKTARSVFATLEKRDFMRRVIFSSFRVDFIADIKADWPAARTAVLFGAVNIDAVKLAQAVGADYVHPCWEDRAEQPHRLLRPEWIEAVRAAKLGLVCWHEERPAEIAALKALGVDAICSDRPDLLRD